MRAIWSVVMVLLSVAANANAAPRQFYVYANPSKTHEVPVLVFRTPEVPPCAVMVRFGGEHAQIVRLESARHFEVKHRLKTDKALTVEVVGQPSSSLGGPALPGCLGEPQTIEVSKVGSGVWVSVHQWEWTDNVYSGSPGYENPRDTRSPTDSVAQSAQPSSPPANPSGPASTPAPSTSGLRVALVIGNDAYRHHDTLPNSVNDTRLIGDALRRLGFDVIPVANASRVEMMTAFEKFEARAVGADAAVFYFSGHGLQDRSRRNFLMPVDARLQGEASISGYGVDAELLVGIFERLRARVGLILLDACRDWPPGRVSRVASSKNVLLKAMSRIEPAPHAENEVIVQFATREGETADPGTGEYSPYALALAAALPQAANRPIRSMLEYATDETLRRTGSTQKPVLFGEMRTTSFLLEPVRSAPFRVVGSDEEQWRRIELKASKDDLAEFVERHPRSQYAVIARARIEHLEERARYDVLLRDQEAWMEASSQGTREALDGYLRQMPAGAFRTHAKAMLDAIAQREHDGKAAHPFGLGYTNIESGYSYTFTPSGNTTGIRYDDAHIGSPGFTAEPNRSSPNSLDENRSLPSYSYRPSFSYSPSYSYTPGTTTYDLKLNAIDLVRIRLQVLRMMSPGEEQAWAQVVNSTSIVTLEVFLELHPKGQYAALAVKRIAELKAARPPEIFQRDSGCFTFNNTIYCPGK